MRLLWVGKDRTMHSIEKFFTLIGQELAGKVEFVCSDVCLAGETAAVPGDDRQALPQGAEHPGPLP